MTRFILRYRPLTAFIIIYGALAAPGAALALSAATVSPESGAALAMVVSLVAFTVAAGRAAAGQGLWPFRFVGGTGVPRVLSIRRHRLRHAAAFAIVAGAAQAGVLAALSQLCPDDVAWPGPGTIAALLAVHAVLAAVSIHTAACTVDALRRAFAMARPGL